MSSAEVGSSRTTNFGSQRHGPRDGDALALPARELVRVAVHGGGIEPGVGERPRHDARAAPHRSQLHDVCATVSPSSTISATERRGESDP